MFMGIQAWIWVVILAQAILFFVGMRMTRERARREAVHWELPLSIRMILSGSLVAVAWWLWQNGGDLPYSQWAFWGMFLSFAGDLSMAGLIPWPNRLIGGMITFAAVHVLYIVAFVKTGARMQGGSFAQGIWISALLYGSILIVSWLLWIRNPKHHAVLNFGALGYGLWVGGMASFAFASAYARGGVWWVAALGGLLFVLSDLLIGVTEVGGRKIKHAAIWIWATYVTAQMAILYVAV